MPDHSRPLNGRGFRDAVTMGQRMTGWEVKPDLLVCSSAVRAWNTTELIAKEMNYSLHDVVVEPNIYEAYEDNLFGVIYALDDAIDHIALIGHNPGFTQMANLLANVHIDNLPTCGIVVIQFDIEKWTQVKPLSGKLHKYDYPKNTEG